MKYWQPFGISDPNAPYINGDPTIGRAGSIPPAGVFEQPQRELVNLISYSNMNPSDASVDQVMHAVRSQYINYAVADPSTDENTITVNFNPKIGGNQTNGMPLRIKAAKTNTGPCFIVCDGITAPLRRADTAELTANDLRASTIFECIWNDTFWAMTNYHGLGGGGGSTSNTYITKIPYTVDTSPTANSIVAAYIPAITTFSAGDAIEVKLKNTITGPTTITVNALPPVAIVRGDGTPLRQNDAFANQVMLLIRTDANNFQFSGIIPQSFGMAMPIGSIIITCGSAAPIGTLKLNGALLNRVDHPGLWTFANASNRIVDESAWQAPVNRNWTAFSRGDGTATFRLPDFRGEFPRWFDDGRGIDPSRLLAVQQGDVVGALAMSGVVDLVNPKLTMGPWPPSSASPIPPPEFYDRNMELVTRGGAWFYTFDEQSGYTTLHQHAPHYSQPSWGGVGGSTGGTAEEVTWVNEAVHDGDVEFIYPHIDSRITSNINLSGSGGGAETRPRNTALMPCIVDG